MINVFRKFLVGSRLLKNGQPEVIELIFSFRYASFFMTGIFYVLDGSVSLIIYKIAVVVSLFVASRILTDIYMNCSNNAAKLRATILLESFAITLLLVPTGGLNSPFLWYALNPVLVAAWYLSSYFCWFNLLFYISAATLISAGLFKKGGTIELIRQHQYLLLVFILITLLVQSLSTLLKRLQIANEKQRESMEQLMSLYQVLEACTTEDNGDCFFQTYSNYTAKLTKSRLAFFWHNTASTGSKQLYTNVEINDSIQSALENDLNIKIRSIKDWSAMTFKIENVNYQYVPVKSSAKLYGVLGVEIGNLRQNNEITLAKHLFFLSDLAAIILDRFSTEDVNSRLMLLEERNRIANEIHDSVSQRLFSISSSLYMLKNQWNSLPEGLATEQLTLLSDSASCAMRELRKSIYSLSTQKSGEQILFSSIKSYLSDFARLNRINLNVSLNGEENLVSAKLKKCLYRIICEATGNSVKHGNCNTLSVRLDLFSEGIRLFIEDNGQGFELNEVNSEKSGLGLINMKNIVQSYGGKFLISSRFGIGTKVEIEIPNSTADLWEQGGTA